MQEVRCIKSGARTADCCCDNKAGTASSTSPFHLLLESQDQNCCQSMQARQARVSAVSKHMGMQARRCHQKAETAQSTTPGRLRTPSATWTTCWARRAPLRTGTKTWCARASRGTAQLQLQHVCTGSFTRCRRSLELLDRSWLRFDRVPPDVICDESCRAAGVNSPVRAAAGRTGRR